MRTLWRGSLEVGAVILDGRTVNADSTKETSRSCLCGGSISVFFLGEIRHEHREVQHL